MAIYLDSLVVELQRTITPLTAALHSQERPWMNKMFEKVEQTSNNKIKREHIALSLGAVLALYFILGSLAQLLCNTVGFVYPAYASITALRALSPSGSVPPTTQALDDVRQWLTYWVVFACFSLVDISAFSAIPLYWLAKVAFLVYLYLPAFRGASMIYATYVDPTLARFEEFMKPKSS